jgi:hypothetical protein
MDKITGYFRPKLNLRESKKNSTVFSLKKVIKSRGRNSTSAIFLLNLLYLDSTY